MRWSFFWSCSLLFSFLSWFFSISGASVWRWYLGHVPEHWAHHGPSHWGHHIEVISVWDVWRCNRARKNKHRKETRNLSLIKLNSRMMWHCIEFNTIINNVWFNFVNTDNILTISVLYFGRWRGIGDGVRMKSVRRTSNWIELGWTRRKFITVDEPLFYFDSALLFEDLSSVGEGESDALFLGIVSSPFKALLVRLN